jgi:hypothetical protein
MRFVPILLALSAFSTATVAATLPADHSNGAAPIVLAANAKLPNEGKAVTVIDTGMYTYVEVSQGDKTVWIAAPSVDVKKGDTIGFDDGAVMTNFFSKTLNRTFPQVIFVGKAAVVK